MRPRPRPLLVLGFVLAMTLVMLAYRPPNPVQSRALKDVETRLKAHYRRIPLPAGWTLIEVAARARQAEVWVDLAVDPAHPAVRAGKPYRGLAEAMAGLCPPKSDPLWQLVGHGQEIELRARAGGDAALVAVNCRAEGK